MTELVILVDEGDRPIGTAEKMTAHIHGWLHRAFSIFIVNPQGELLLQRRAWTKYHSGGLWTNTCCSHPRPDEPLLVAGQRRLMEEMGIACHLQELFCFTYRAELECGLIEHEFDHVLIGECHCQPQPNPAEVADWRWMGMADLEKELSAHPERYTYWLRSCFDQFQKHYRYNAYTVTL